MRNGWGDRKRERGRWRERERQNGGRLKGGTLRPPRAARLTLAPADRYANAFIHATSLFYSPQLKQTPVRL